MSFCWLQMCEYWRKAMLASRTTTEGEWPLHHTSQVSLICMLQIDDVSLLSLRGVAERRAPRVRTAPRERPTCEVPLVTNPDPDPSASIPVPRHLTLLARSQFETAMREYGAELSQLMWSRAAGRPIGPFPEFTADDVRAAQLQYGRRERRSHPGPADRYLSPALVTVGSVGVGVMSAFLNGTWQVALFCAFAVLGLLGLGLAWACGADRARP
jgi:hypothetical protein